MKYSKSQIEKIKKLRKKGFSIPEISNILSISKSTVLRHAQGIIIQPQYLQRWLNRRKSSTILLNHNLSVARRDAQVLLNKADSRENAIITSLLYWAEGSKKDFSLSNTDPRLISTFIKSLKRTFGLMNDNFKISIRIYEDLDLKECIKFWSLTTGISLDDKTKVNIIKGSKKGKLQYGMCRVRIRKGGIILKTIFSIIDHIGKLESPRSSVDRARHS